MRCRVSVCNPSIKVCTWFGHHFHCIEGQHTLSAATVSKKTLLSAAEIASLRLPGLPTTKANVIVRAEKEGWYFEETTGLGGKRRVYELPDRYREGSAKAACLSWLEHDLGNPNLGVERIGSCGGHRAIGSRDSEHIEIQC